MTNKLTLEEKETRKKIRADKLKIKKIERQTEAKQLRKLEKIKKQIEKAELKQQLKLPIVKQRKEREKITLFNKNIFKQKIGKTLYLSHNVPDEEKTTSLNIFFKIFTPSLKTILEKELQRLTNLKVYLTVKVHYFKVIKNEFYELDTLIIEVFHSAKLKELYHNNEIINLIKKSKVKIQQKITEFLANGSGWNILFIDQMIIKTLKYSPLSGSNYIQLPDWIKNKNCCINIQNEDDKCFQYSVLCGLYQEEIKDHLERVSKYTQYMNKIKISDLSNTVSLCNINKFEKLNEITINVFGVGKSEIFIYYKSKTNYNKTVDLLLLEEEEKTHYVLIKNFSRLMNTKTVQKFWCKNCLHGFYNEQGLINHSELCDKLGTGNISLPKIGENILSFKNYNRKFETQFVIYADFECYLKPVYGPQKLNESMIYQQHQPSGFCLCIVKREGGETAQALNVLNGDHTHNLYRTRHYTGLNCMEEFYKQLKFAYFDIQKEIQNFKELNMTVDDEKIFQKATNCIICEKKYAEGDVKHRHHCHLSGKFIGSAHQVCNQNLKVQAKIPVFFHNLKKYDSHLIFSSIEKSAKIKCIAQNFENYISFTIDNFIFKDTYQFLPDALCNLVKNIKDDDKPNSIKFKMLLSYFKELTPEQQDLITRKGIFPYDWFNDETKLNETQLPPIESFYSKLNEESIDENDYRTAQTVWNKFNCKTFKDYHDLYMITDVLLLADVFEEFRNMSLNFYKLDPTHYYTSPSLSWDACLKMTKQELELITDIDIYQFVESGIRGGISTITHRYAKANNKYMKTYNKAVKSSYINYLDANNLYGYAMTQNLPVSDFKFAKDVSKFTEKNIMTVSDKSDKGFILEVDLEYPKELHDLHNDYPLAPERIKIDNKMLSEYCKSISEEFNLGSSKVEKLVPNLQNKTKYIVHYRNLQLYLSLGMKLSKVHRVLEFTQKPWMKTYINFNTEQRKIAKNPFLKDFFKLMNNSCFGKTMENVRNHIDVHLFTSQQTKLLQKYINKPLLKDWRIFNENLIGVHMNREIIILNKPIYSGFAILDLSKHLMYDFWYNTMKKKYNDKIKLLMTDTDSLVFNVETEDLYADYKTIQDKLDCSEYPKNHILYNETNKKIIGKFKDESANIQIIEFVGLRSKMYAYKCDNDKEAKKAKGIKKCAVKNSLHFENYYNALFPENSNDKRQTVNFNLIQSVDHQLTTKRICKVGLCCYDDKRYLLDNINSLAYGHYKSKKNL